MAVVTRPIVALDVPSFDDAVEIVDRLGDACDFYKVGLQLYAAEGPDIVEWLRTEEKSVFVDLKAYDIPNTVRGVAGSVAALGASLLTVHAAGGEAMIRAAIEGAKSEGDCGILVVTVLTSFDAAGYSAAAGRETVDIVEEVRRQARVANAAGAFGIVCSGREAAFVRKDHGDSLRILVPGVRMPGDKSHDQARTVTPAEAAAEGASYVVLGRAVTQANDPVSALSAICAQLGLT